MYRIGFASDIHRLVSNRKLILGGVEIPYHLGLLGHSDADVVCHALSEAMLGALALGDLGTYFPDTDMKYKNIDSTIILKDYIMQMRINLAKVLSAEVDKISIKAGTNEGVDAVGREEACVATAIVLLKRGD